ncbi:ferredoxin [Micractinium conductrix]|uniref:Ferredoxin n=1 Tax=Micractinium conductrix TaxID=554055 RepID=A0A2P6V585_9CHLO|nr:ferredoxin [Micractinium conductrix]|eukprot:PSC69244.1 ferredoxin [Micractinium conductrix]
MQCLSSKLAAPRAFAAAPRQHAAARNSVKAQAYKVTFVDQTSGAERTCEISADDYLLDGADASRIDLNASCRGGVCGTCVSKLRSGQVDMEWLSVLDDGNVLSQEQVAAGYILPCSAKPLSDCVVETSKDWGHTTEANPAALLHGCTALLSPERYHQQMLQQLEQQQRVLQHQRAEQDAWCAMAHAVLQQQQPARRGPALVARSNSPDSASTNERKRARQGTQAGSGGDEPRPQRRRGDAAAEPQLSLFAGLQGDCSVDLLHFDTQQLMDTFPEASAAGLQALARLMSFADAAPKQQRLGQPLR